MTDFKNIVFIGAGGFASECYMYLQDVMQHDKTLSFKGFLSTDNNLESYGLSHMFLGHYDDYVFEKNDYIVIAIGDSVARKNIYNNFKSRGLKFYTLISPRAFIPNKANIGECSIIAPFVTIAFNVKIGVGNVLNCFSGVGHDSVIGNFNVFSSHTDICGFATIGDVNFFGSRTSVLPHTTVGSGNKISAGSVVVKRVRDNCLMQGNPAIKLCMIEEI